LPEALAADIRVVDVPDRSRVEIRVDGEVAGFTEYRRRRALISFIHTETDPRFKRRGLASKLVRTALTEAGSQRLSVLPFCPFVRAYIGGHTECLALVPESTQAKFDLPADA
jgi:uncharacterized protein